MAKKSLTYEDVKAYIEKMGGRLLSSTYISNRDKIEVECLKCQNIWHPTYSNIKLGTWCPKCAGQKRLTIEDAITDAKKHNGYCLSPSFNTCRDKLKWQCENGHIFIMRLKSVREGCWCRICSNNIKKLTLDVVCKEAEKYGGKCLSAEYVGSGSLLQWECHCGNIFTSTYDNVKQGHWCPRCSYGKSQKKLLNIIKSIFNDKIIFSNYKGFDWLYNKKTGGKQEVDIWIPELKLAVEYDGRQHFEPVIFGNMKWEDAKKEFKATKRRDRLKNKKIRAHKKDINFFVRFNYKELHNLNKEYVENKLKEIGIVKEEFENA